MVPTNSLSFEEFQTLLSQSFVNPGCLLPANTRNHEFHLGPAFNTGDAVGRSSVAQIFPTSYTFPFLEPLPLPSLHSAGTRNWSNSDTSFRAWDRATILDILELTLDIPTFDPTLFSITFCFWTSDYNTFVFPLGPMFVTLRDISALTNLPPIGATISPAMVVTHTPPQ
ncbi:Aminotransferase-like [Abeliophyllum distichum]|uniref:Aminotransferase-like n=1 Tax=Abeliophyllum distichum TaxID=126358 RepID=A0ABD1RFR7_9LAMI